MHICDMFIISFISPDFSTKFRRNFAEISQVVRILMADPRVDPCQSGQCWGQRNEALRNAIENNHRNIIEILMQDDRVIQELKKPEKPERELPPLF